MSNNSRHSTVLALGFGAALAGCGNVSGTDTPNVGKPMTYQHGSDATTTFSPGATGLQYNAGSSALVDPVVDYMLALRTASLKLRGNLPSLLEQENLKNAIDSGNADDAQNTYESLVKGYINNSPALFNKQMFHFWRNTMRMGGPTPLNALFSDTATTMKSVDLDTAPAFAAMLVANDRPMTDLFTAQDPTCPTFDQVSGNFTPANCYMGATATTGNNVPSGSQAGVLTNPGFLAQYYSNRARVSQTSTISRACDLG